MKKFISDLLPAWAFAPLVLLTFAASLVKPADSQTALPVQQAWRFNGNDIYAANSGNVGLGTSAPTSKLDVINSAPGGIGVSGVHSATTGTAPGVYGETDSGSNNAVGVQGFV